MVKRYILGLFVLLLWASAWAVPAKRVRKTITLADGSRKEVVLVGDENVHFYLDSLNNAYTCDETGTFHSADLPTLESRWEERLAERNKHRLERAEARGMNVSPLSQREAGVRRRATWGAETNPVSGDKRGLVILVNFPDRELNDAHGPSYYEGYFNEVGFRRDGNHGSVHDYFYECSYGQFNLTFDIFGPVTVSKSYTYYGKNDSMGDDLYPAELLSEACRLANTQGVDFRQYDWDSDGEVDQVFVVYAGYGENNGAASNSIWPHECTLSEEAKYGDGEGPVWLDGVKIDTYALSCELDGRSGTTPVGIGTACHEFSHCMCLPDFYSPDGKYYGMDAWDLMDFGNYSGDNRGTSPVAYTSYERMYCGWLTPTVLSEPCFVTDMKSLYEAPEAYIIYNDANHKEYYMLENRQGEGFLASSPAKGMLVLHVYFDGELWAKNRVNTNATQHMTIIPADGKLTYMSGYADTWPGVTGNTALTDDTYPAATLYLHNTDGRKMMGKPIEHIQETGGRISFTFDGGMVLDTPLATNATGVRDDGFTARWDGVEKAEGYRVRLMAEDLEPLPYSLDDMTLIAEDFAQFNNGTDAHGSSDISSRLDDYTSRPGWKGDYLYTTPEDAVELGNVAMTGFLYTPKMTVESDIVTLVFTAHSTDYQDTRLQLILGEDYEGRVIEEVITETKPTRYVFTVKVKNKQLWWGLSSYMRCRVSDMRAYDAELTEEEINEDFTTLQRTQTSEVETAGTSYAFTNLSNLRRYSYSVCAVRDIVQSQWSNTINVHLPTEEETVLRDVNVNDKVNHYYTLDGRRIPALQRGVNIVRTLDGKVRKIVIP